MPPKRFPIRKCEATKSSNRIWRRKNKHETSLVGTSSFAEFCVWAVFHSTCIRKGVFSQGGEKRGWKKKVSNGVPPGSTTWVKSPPLRKDHELAHALDQSLVSRCSSVLTDASESKVWEWGAQEGWRVLSLF